MPGTLRLVVARHQENLDWIRKVPKKWNVSVVTKGVQVPNTGREASSYLYAMEKYYEDDGWTMFVQGDPFEHYPPLMKVLEQGSLPLRFCPLGFRLEESDEDGAPWDGGLPVRQYFEDLVGPWTGNVQFAPGAQFVLPSWLIRGRPKEELVELRQRVDADPLGAWTMERLWFRYFVS
jgi:hypothetical protein